MSLSVSSNNMSPLELEQQLLAGHHAGSFPDFGRKVWHGLLDYFKYVLTPPTITINPHDLIMEFGVWYRSSLMAINEYTGKNFVYGFDTFSGLPEAWVADDGQILAQKGEFKIDVAPENTAKNIFVVGMVEDTYQTFLQSHPEKIQYMHLDMDLYAPTKFVLEKSVSRFQRGTIITIDDFYGFPGWRVGTCLAFCEVVNKYNLSVEIVASAGLVGDWSNVTFRITDVPNRETSSIDKYTLKAF